MSAYIVSNETISAIVKGFEIYKTKYHGEGYKPQTGWLIELNKERQAIGQSLLNQNYRSVNYRYNEDTTPERFVFKDVYVTPSIIYGCIHNYEYQACETDDYFLSEVHKSLDELQHNMLERILKIQYGDYPWGYPEPEEPETKKPDLIIIPSSEIQEPEEDEAQITLFKEDEWLTN